MKEVNNQRGKRCPICEKQYPEEDTYCGDDGTVLERALTTKDLSESAGTPIPADDVNAGRNSVLQH